MRRTTHCSSVAGRVSGVGLGRRLYVKQKKKSHIMGILFWCIVYLLCVGGLTCVRRQWLHVTMECAVQTLRDSIALRK